MRRPTARPTRLLPDGTPLRNRLLTALPAYNYRRLTKHLRMMKVTSGETLQQHGARITRVYFPNGGVFSITNHMRDGTLVEVATVGREGMLGIGVFLGDPVGAGRTCQQVADGAVPWLGVAQFLEETRRPGPFRDAVSLYAQAKLLQVMQCTACNALHDVTQRCCRWLLQAHDRVEGNDFPMKHEFLAAMLGVRRPTVTVVMQTLQRAGLIVSRYGRIDIVDRTGLEEVACECYAVIREHFERLRL